MLPSGPVLSSPGRFGAGTMSPSAALAHVMQDGAGALRRAMDSIGEREVLDALEPASDLDPVERACRLLSPAADPLRAAIGARAAVLTRARFQNRVRLHAMLWLSTHCQSRCRYCYLSADNRIARHVLSEVQLEREADALAQRGIAEVVLCTGDAPRRFGVLDLCLGTTQAREFFSSVGVEGAPLKVEEYGLLHLAGARSVTVYQETYDVESYTEVHRAGRKRDLPFRLGALERAAEAGFQELGLGALLGLGDWRADGVCLALHATLLAARYPRVALTVSLRTLRHGPFGYRPPEPVSETEFEHLMAVLRLVLPRLDLGISADEPPELRDRLAAAFATRIGVTVESGIAGVDQQPTRSVGGLDQRTPQALRARLRASGTDVH